MSGWFSGGFLLLIGFVWIVTAIQSRRLYSAFLAKYPEDAMRLIPFAFSNSRHPEKLVFFFRRIALPMLTADPSLWRLRRQLKVLLFMSFLFPIAFFVVLLIYAIRHTGVTF